MIRARSTTKASKILFALSMIALPLLLGACSKDAPLNFLHPEGPGARKADELWDLGFAIAVVVFVLVEGALVFILVKYRQKSRDESPQQVHGNTKLELIWTAIPALLLVVVAIPTVGGIVDLSAEPPGDPVKVKVIAHQWWWEYQYDNGVVTANELHMPVGRPVRLEMTATDVVHSFWVPKLAGKQDVVPGRVNKLTLFAERADSYLGQCAEYCGLSHANMRVKVIAQTPEDFDEWVADQKAPRAAPVGALATQGEQLFMEKPCAGCHAIEGTAAVGQVGPNLTHFASRTTFAAATFDRNDAQLRAWLRDPPKRKPGAKMPNLHLKEDEIIALVTYLQGLK